VTTLSRNLLACAGSLAALALINRAAARRAERTHPPAGHFIEIDGVRLHYTDRGVGRPIVLIHGNATSEHDFDTSGIAEVLVRTNRVIAFDRPGSGYSERPRGHLWTATQQADLLHKALAQMQVQRPILVAHSWGMLAALALALDHPSDTAGLVLISGYYFPTVRLDAPLVAPVAIPFVGDILRYTVSPVLGRLLMPGFKRMLFAPAPVPARFRTEYASGMALRPSQVRATAVDGTLLVPSVMSLCGRYGELDMPVIIMAGDGDKIVGNRQSKRLRRAIPGSVLHIVEGAGHMVHHLASRKVVAAIAEVGRRAGGNMSEERPLAA